MATRPLQRLWRHAWTDRRDAQRAFPADALQRIEAAIAQGERTHAGQVVFAVEAALPMARVLGHVPPRDRALEAFGLLRVWDTEHNNGVLVYLLLADRDVEIVADRGIHRRVGDEAWPAICSQMEEAFRAGRYAEGVERGIARINALLAEHFPREGAGEDELPNAPRML